jgi:uncharacterized protein
MPGTSGTQTEANREIISGAFDAWHRGTGAITDVFAPGMVWRIEGHSAASREYGSKQEFMNSYAWIMRMNDGLVVDGTAFYDSISFNELWARVQPR